MCGTSAIQAVSENPIARFPTVQNHAEESSSAARTCIESSTGRPGGTIQTPILARAVGSFLLIMWLGPATAYGQWPLGITVEETFHNLRVPAQVQDSDMLGLVRDFGEVCVYCHSPHGGRTDKPLWNRRVPTGPYRMYEDGQMQADPQPTGNSLSCLSCHDGTIGLDDVLDLPGAYAGPLPSATSIEECDGCHGGGSPPAGLNFEGVWFDTDFRKQHPISVLYDPLVTPGAFRSAAEVEAAGLLLFDGKVQCMTCHEPHSQQFPPFLRIPNTGNTLCLSCHTSSPAETTAHFW